jgi:hypothetical protein
MVIVLYFVEDLIEALGTISARLGLIWFIGFRGNLNVKVYALSTLVISSYSLSGEILLKGRFVYLIKTIVKHWRL